MQHTIQAANLSFLKDRISKINRRAKKLGCAPVELKVLGERTEERKGPNGSRYRIYLTDIELTGEAPRVEGYAFLATIEHTASGNLVRATPAHEGELDPRWRTVEPYCQHCNASRRRKETFLVQDTTGRTIQVGRNCLVDYLGGLDPAHAVALAETYAKAVSAAEEAGGWGCGGEIFIDVEFYLGFVAAAMRNEGWLSRTAARERVHGMATADVALDVLVRSLGRAMIAPPPKEYLPTDKDRARAKEALAWTKADLEQRRDLNDYQYNLHVIIGEDKVDHKRAGFAASIIGYHARGIEREIEWARKNADKAAQRAASEHVGEIKERLTLEGVTVEGVREMESDWGVTFLYKMRCKGNALSWFASKDQELKAGDVVALKGTVKKHDEYKGEKQTVLTRCVVLKEQQINLFFHTTLPF